MKPYKIIKTNSNPFQKKVKIITELKEPKVPLKFFKMKHFPKRKIFVVDGCLVTEDQLARQRGSSCSDPNL